VNQPPTVNLPPPPPPAELGLACRRCGATAFRTAWQTFANGTRHVRADCAGCGTFARYLKQAGSPDFKSEMAPAGTPANLRRPPTPESDWEWLGLVRLADQQWRPVALAPSLARCWEALLTYPGEPDRLCIPSLVSARARKEKT
jgi:hypothetical protein